MSRISALDGLRGVAILLVLLWHGVVNQESAPPLVHSIGKLSWSGVDLFFVLSGFLIGGILLDAKASPHYYQTFYLRRALRILPVYMILLGCYFLLRPTTAGEWLWFQQTRPPAVSLLTFTQNFWMALPKYFGGGIGPTWSLAIEEQFYVLMPLVVRKLSLKPLVCVLVGAIILAPLLRLEFIRFYPELLCAPYVLMPCRADALSLGVLCALLVRHPRVHSHVLPFVVPTLLLLLVPLVWLGHHGNDPFSKSIATLGYSLLAPSFMLAVFCWHLGDACPFWRIAGCEHSAVLLTEPIFCMCPC